MHRALRFSTMAREHLEALNSPDSAALLKQVNKALGLLQNNPAHPSLNTHEFTALSTKERKLFEAYAQNNTPAAYRIFWHYGPDEMDPKTKKRIPIITIVSITQHP